MDNLREIIGVKSDRIMNEKIRELIGAGRESQK